MTDPITIQDLADANLDLESLSKFINSNGNSLTTRLGGDKATLTKIIDDLANKNIGIEAAAIINAKLDSIIRYQTNNDNLIDQNTASFDLVHFLNDTIPVTANTVSGLNVVYLKPDTYYTFSGLGVIITSNNGYMEDENGLKTIINWLNFTPTEFPNSRYFKTPNVGDEIKVYLNSKTDNINRTINGNIMLSEGIGTKPYVEYSANAVINENALISVIEKFIQINNEDIFYHISNSDNLLDINSVTGNIKHTATETNDRGTSIYAGVPTLYLEAGKSYTMSGTGSFAAFGHYIDINGNYLSPIQWINTNVVDAIRAKYFNMPLNASGVNLNVRWDNDNDTFISDRVKLELGVVGGDDPIAYIKGLRKIKNDLISETFRPSSSQSYYSRTGTTDSNGKTLDNNGNLITAISLVSSLPIGANKVVYNNFGPSGYENSVIVEAF